MTPYFHLLALLVVQITDVYTTAEVLKRGGVEVNPIARYLFDKIGMFSTMLLLKGAIMAAGVAALTLADNGWIFTALLTLFGVGVSVNNFIVLKKIKLASKTSP